MLAVTLARRKCEGVWRPLNTVPQQTWKLANPGTRKYYVMQLLLRFSLFGVRYGSKSLNSCRWYENWIYEPHPGFSLARESCDWRTLMQYGTSAKLRVNINKQNVITQWFLFYKLGQAGHVYPSPVHIDAALLSLSLSAPSWHSGYTSPMRSSTRGIRVCISLGRFLPTWDGGSPFKL